MVFVALLVGGLLLLAVRMVAAPGVNAVDMLLPIVGGVLIALAIALMVRRERNQRRRMTPEERNRPEEGMPP